MFKAIVGIISAFFVVTSGAPSLLSENQLSLDAEINGALHHSGIMREFYVFPAFLKGKFAKRKVGYLVFSNHEIDKPRFLSLKDKRYGEALSLIQTSGVYRGAPAEQAFSPVFDSSVYRKPSFTIRSGIIIPNNDDKILQRKSEASEPHSTDNNFESSLIQRLQDLKKESHVRSSGIEQEQRLEKPIQTEANSELHRPIESDSVGSLTHMAFESDVSFDVELEGFLNDENQTRTSQNANDNQGSSRNSGDDLRDSSKFSHSSTGINEDSFIRKDTDRSFQNSFIDDTNTEEISKSFTSSNGAQSDSKSTSIDFADDNAATSASSSNFNSPFSSLHLSPEEIVQAILEMSDSINVGNSQNDVTRIPFRISDGTLVANRINKQDESLFRLGNYNSYILLHPNDNNSTPTISDDTDAESNRLSASYTKSEGLLLINHGRNTANSKPIFIKTYILRFGNRRKPTQREGSTINNQHSSHSHPSAVILGFRDAVSHGLAEGLARVLNVRLVEDNEEIEERIRNKRHVFSIDFDNVSIEVLE